ncbi:MAG: YkgJ family cysteine cluster protein [Cyclobacteriaceae bacterium]|nr:YkgJ family cysteine cluster protein [Cyclobacteriaceae bacterium]
MSIVRKVKAVERLFAQLQVEQIEFQKKTGLGCLPGCGKCCHKSDIHATVLEFLPLAMHYFMNDVALDVLQKLREDKSPVCNLLTLYVQGQSGGLCGNYTYRGLICRIFGFSAMKNKHGLLSMITCGEIKQNMRNEFENAEKNINNGLKIPLTSDYYRQLSNIDPILGEKTYPINEAVARAIEEVLHYYAYRPKPKPHRITLRKTA